MIDKEKIEAIIKIVWKSEELEGEKYNAVRYLESLLCLLNQPSFKEQVLQLIKKRLDCDFWPTTKIILVHLIEEIEKL